MKLTDEQIQRIQHEIMWAMAQALRIERNTEDKNLAASELGLQTAVSTQAIVKVVEETDVVV